MTAPSRATGARWQGTGRSTSMAQRKFSKTSKDTEQGGASHLIAQGDETLSEDRSSEREEGLGASTAATSGTCQEQTAAHDGKTQVQKCSSFALTRTAHQKYQGDAWLRYDEGFREKIQIGPVIE
ncbi:hypothetical protein NDU88_001953 [Pleurodeles waltl]|uniref:Uncharacterized protein n=1 Tax=Pleurodeles waltl TaxID=8319 RepID=A0AAV7UY65_PLEWA|nr:hypothetical protein NDU88_001953 [Pleurodeles waltl]